MQMKKAPIYSHN